MIQTKTEEMNEKKIRERLEELTREIVRVNDKIDEIEKNLTKQPSIKSLVEELEQWNNKLEYLEDERNKFINILNTIW